jgi:Transglycosylase SLT domain/SPOR domain
MQVRAATFIIPLIALFTLAGAHAEDVRVVLPFQPNADPDETLERVDRDSQAVPQLDIGDICDLIAAAADEHGLPRPYFARLIWQESRFDANAVSPAGAQGIAQFMPATALRRRLRNAFDPREAIPASAAYLTDLRREFGNLGLAAAAYNTGEERVSSWLVKDGYLPSETENYVLTILGKPAAEFRNETEDENPKPLHADKTFEEACRALPASPASTILAAESPKPDWGVQVAGHFDRSIALRQWALIRNRHARILGQVEPAVFAVASPRGRKRIHVVQIGASDRREADDLCNRLRLAGGACIVVKN